MGLIKIFRVDQVHLPIRDGLRVVKLGNAWWNVGGVNMARRTTQGAADAAGGILEGMGGKGGRRRCQKQVFQSPRQLIN